MEEFRDNYQNEEFENEEIEVQEFLSGLPGSQEEPGPQLNWLQIVNSLDEADKLGKFRVRTAGERIYLDPPITFLVVREAYRYIRQEADRTIYLTSIFDKNSKPLKRDGTLFNPDTDRKENDIFQQLLFVVILSNDYNHIPAVFPLKKTALRSLYDFKSKARIKSLVKLFLNVSTRQEKNGSVRFYVPVFTLTQIEKVDRKFAEITKEFLGQVDEYINSFNSRFTSATETKQAQDIKPGSFLSKYEKDEDPTEDIPF